MTPIAFLLPFLGSAADLQGVQESAPLTASAIVLHEVSPPPVPACISPAEEAWLAAKVPTDDYGHAHLTATPPAEPAGGLFA